MPVWPGSATQSIAAAASAASTALPPRSSARTPALVASGWLVATIASRRIVGRLTTARLLRDADGDRSRPARRAARLRSGRPRVLRRAPRARRAREASCAEGAWRRLVQVRSPGSAPPNAPQAQPTQQPRPHCRHRTPGSAPPNAPQAQPTQQPRPHCRHRTPGSAPPNAPQAQPTQQPRPHCRHRTPGSAPPNAPQAQPTQQPRPHCRHRTPGSAPPNAPQAQPTQQRSTSPWSASPPPPSPPTAVALAIDAPLPSAPAAATANTAAPARSPWASTSPNAFASSSRSNTNSTSSPEAGSSSRSRSSRLQVMLIVACSPPSAATRSSTSSGAPSGLVQNVRDLAARHARAHRALRQDVALQMRRTDCIHCALFPRPLVCCTAHMTRIVATFFPSHKARHEPGERASNAHNPEARRPPVPVSGMSPDRCFLPLCETRGPFAHSRASCRRLRLDKEANREPTDPECPRSFRTRRPLLGSPGWRAFAPGRSRRRCRGRRRVPARSRIRPRRVRR